MDKYDNINEVLIHLNPYYPEDKNSIRNTFVLLHLGL